MELLVAYQALQCRVCRYSRDIENGSICSVARLMGGEAAAMSAEACPARELGGESVERRGDPYLSQMHTLRTEQAIIISYRMVIGMLIVIRVIAIVLVIILSSA